MINEKINYVELPAKDLAATKRFFSAAFGWEFTDFGPEYTAFSQSGINGGFYQSDLISSTRHGAALIVLYSKALEQSQERVTQAGGAIVKTIFSFPGGRRFHFTDPHGNEYAIWSDVNSVNSNS